MNIAFPNSVREKISVTTVKDTNIVRISVTDANRFFARDFANVLAESHDSMLTYGFELKTAQRTFIESQIPINDQALREANDRLGDFKERSEIIQLSDKSSLLVNQISHYDLRLEPLLQLEEAHIGFLLPRTLHRRQRHHLRSTADNDQKRRGDLKEAQ